MLPDEVLRDIVLPAIARNPEARQLLETLEITSRRLNALATSIFDGDYRIRGLRVVTRMRVYSTGEVIFLTEKCGWPFKSVTFDYLFCVLRRLNVRKVEYLGTFNEAVLEAIIPVVGKLRNALCIAPKTFSSPAMIVRAYSEVLFADELHIEQLKLDGDRRPFAYDGTLVSLPCLQQCRLLSVSSRILATGQLRWKMVQWLNGGVNESAKRLTLGTSATHAKLYDDLKTAFLDATSPSSYELALANAVRFPDYERHVNTRTNEELLFQRYLDGPMMVTRRALLY